MIRRRRPQPVDQGSMAFEMVILTPILIMFVMLVVCAGRYVAVKGDVEAASRDAVRAASLERDSGSAQDAAGMTADRALQWNCSAAQLVPGGFVAGGVIGVTVTCRVPYSDLGLIGVTKTKTVTAVSYAPLDRYRRTGP